MKRKVIKQGIDGLTIYLPKKWSDKFKLKGGDEVEIIEHESSLIITKEKTKESPKTIELTLESGRESKRRTLLLSAYRAGFDKILVNYNGNQRDIQNIAQNYMIGFELFKIDEGKYSLESVAETDYADFDKIVQKMFHATIYSLENIEDENIDQYIEQVQRYDHLLKRLLSKNILSIKASFSFWHFLSNLTACARLVGHLKENYTKKFEKEEKQITQKTVEMLHILQKAYLTKNIQLLSKLHDLDEENNSKGFLLLKKSKTNGIYTHFLLDISRQIYVNSSTLSSIILTESF